MNIKCSKCNEVKPETNFSLRNKSEGIRRSQCKSCDKKYDQKYREEHIRRPRTEYLKYQKKYYAEHKEHIKEYQKKYREEHKEHTKKYYEKNKEYLKKYQKKYYEENKELIKEKRKRKKNVDQPAQ